MRSPAAPPAFALALALALALAAPCAPQRNLARPIVAFDTSNSPFMFEERGRPAGLYPRLFGEAFRRAGVEIDLAALPWRRALESLSDGRCGVGGVYMNAERAAACDYSSPFYAERLAVYTLKGKADAYSSIESLYGKTVGVIAGWYYSEAFSDAIRAGTISVSPTAGDIQNMRMLASARVDAVIAIVESGDLAIRELRLDGIIARSPRMLAVNPVYLAFNKSAGRARIIKLFDEAILSMKADGTFDRIIGESLAEAAPPKADG